MEDADHVIGRIRRQAREYRDDRQFALDQHEAHEAGEWERSFKALERNNYERREVLPACRHHCREGRVPCPTPGLCVTVIDWKRVIFGSIAIVLVLGSSLAVVAVVLKLVRMAIEQGWLA